MKRILISMVAFSTVALLVGSFLLMNNEGYLSTPSPKYSSRLPALYDSQTRTLRHEVNRDFAADAESSARNAEVTSTTSSQTQNSLAPTRRIKQPITQGTSLPVKHHLSPPLPIPFMGEYNCSNKVCTEFLTRRDQARADCLRAHIYRVKFPGTCHFMNGTNRRTVLLMSYPGSGNTWVRGLLERATGICTGSVYCDSALKRGGFNGENIFSGTVLVTKSHSPNWPMWSQSGILLLRNPMDALVAEWNRQHSSGHTGHADESKFEHNTRWNRFAGRSSWIEVIRWLLEGIQAGHPILVVRFEDLRSDLLTQTKRMLEFLKVPYSNEALEERMSEDYEKFHRPSSGTNFNHYTPQQRDHIKGLVREAIDLLMAGNNGNTYGIEDYL